MNREEVTINIAEDYEANPENVIIEKIYKKGKDTIVEGYIDAIILDELNDETYSEVGQSFRITI